MTLVEDNTAVKMKVCPGCGSVDSCKTVGRYLGTAQPFNDKKSKLMGCSQCDLVYMDPLPSEIEIDHFYEDYWDHDGAVQSSTSDSLQGYRAQNTSRVDFIQEQIVSLEGKSVLDFGAGQGFFGDAIKAKRVKNCSYNAVETDLQAVEDLKAKGFKAATKIEAFDGEQFDIVAAFHVLEHLLAPTKVIELLMKYLKPGGFLIIEVPNQDYIWKKNYQPHVVFFNKTSLTTLFKSFRLNSLSVLSCGRSLDVLAKQKSFMKMQRHRVGNVLRALGLRKSQMSDGSVKSVENARREFEMDKFGDERQWLRVVAQKEINCSEN